jgi:AraC-like DNA-binding protein
MAVIVAYLPDPSAAPRLRRALEHGRHRLLFADSWQLLRELGAATPPDVVVADPFCSADGLEHCAALRGAHPACELLPYGRLDGRPAHDLFRLFALGVQGLVVRDRDDAPAALRQAVETVLERRMADTVLAAVGELFPGPLHSLLRYLLLHAETPLQPDDVARSQHCHSKTLRARLRAAGLPSLNRLIIWTRLLGAAHRVATSGRPLEQVAVAMDFPSAAALRTQLQRYAGMPAHELRRPGAVERLAERFRHAAAQPVHAMAA